MVPTITRSRARGDPDFTHAVLQPRKRLQRRSQQKQARETVFASNRRGSSKDDKLILHFGEEHVIGVRKCQETMNSTCTKILKLAELIEKFKELPNLSEKIMGDLEAFAGKARLLVNSKLKKQYQKMLNDALDPKYTPPTKVSDLKGFWEMVEIQIGQTDADHKRILKLKENNWIEVEQATLGPTSKVLKPKNKPASVKPVSSKSSETAKLRMEKMKAFKAEMKAKAKQKREGDSENLLIL